jgi:hypothetical protein
MNAPANQSNKYHFIAIHVLLPIIIGGGIYTLWRKPTLQMFMWYRELGLETTIAHLRELAADTRHSIPYWVLFSLPDGLWVYALTAFMTIIWQGSNSSINRTGWLTSGLFLGAGSEVGQLAGVIPGTFDLTDFLICCIATATAVFVARLHAFKQKTLPGGKLP